MDRCLSGGTLNFVLFALASDGYVRIIICLVRAPRLIPCSWDTYWTVDFLDDNVLMHRSDGFEFYFVH